MPGNNKTRFNICFINYFSIIFFCLFYWAYPIYSQGHNHLLKAKLIQADSVIIVSHEATAGIMIIDDSTGKAIPLPELIIHGRPNEKIITERKRITGKDLGRLIKILDRPFLDRIIKVA